MRSFACYRYRVPGILVRCAQNNVIIHNTRYIHTTTITVKAFILVEHYTSTQKLEAYCRYTHSRPQLWPPVSSTALTTCSIFVFAHCSGFAFNTRLSPTVVAFLLRNWYSLLLLIPSVSIHLSVSGYFRPDLFSRFSCFPPFFFSFPLIFLLRYSTVPAFLT